MSTRTVLLDHAEALARSRGFEAFSFADLAAAINIRKPSVHHHFATKADLALALITRYREAFLQRLADIDAPTAADRLGTYLATQRAALGQGDWLCLCIAFAIHRDSFDTAVHVQISGFQRDNLNWLADLFAMGQMDGTLPNGDPVAAAHACLAQVEGAQIMARAAGDTGLFDRATALLRPR